MANDGVIRRRVVPFTMVANEPLRGDKLSYGARGLYATIQSFLQIDGWVLHKSHLMHICPEGEKAFNRIWKELIDSGYLVTYKLKGEKGQFVYEYELVESVSGTNECDIKNIVSKSETSTPYSRGGERRPAAGGGYDITNELRNNKSDLSKEKERKIEIDETLIPERVRSSRKYSIKKVTKVIMMTKADISPEALKMALRDSNANFESARSIKDPYAYYCQVLQNEILSPNTNDSNMGKSPAKAGNRFHNFNQRNTDYDSLLGMKKPE